MIEKKNQGSNSNTKKHYLTEEEKTQAKKDHELILGMAMGVPAGYIMGYSLENLGLGLIIGISLGFAFTVLTTTYLREKNKKQ